VQEPAPTQVGVSRGAMFRAYIKTNLKFIFPKGQNNKRRNRAYRMAYLGTPAPRHAPTVMGDAIHNLRRSRYPLTRRRSEKLLCGIAKALGCRMIGSENLAEQAQILAQKRTAVAKTCGAVHPRPHVECKASTAACL
jgi:hypothetical protein